MKVFSPDELSVIRVAGRGGEGTVYEVTTPAGERLAYKRYHPDVLSQRGVDLERKLRAMLTNPPHVPSGGMDHAALLWPIAIVMLESNFYGFCMPLLSDTNLKLVSIVDARGRQRSAREDWTWAARLVICHNLCIALSALHSVGAAYGDLNEENAVVNRDGLVTLLDLDSISLQTTDGTYYPGSGATRDDWRPPEYSESSVFTQDGDSWALAVQIYMLLMESTRPYSASGVGYPPVEAVRRGTFPVLDPSLLPPRSSPPLDLLPPSLRALFKRTFGAGKDRPELRPRASEYATAITAILGTLRSCPDVPSHVWAPPRTVCPWCERNRSAHDQPPHQNQIRIPQVFSGGQLAESSARSAPPQSTESTAQQPLKRKSRTGRVIAGVGCAFLIIAILLVIVVMAGTLMLLSSF
ncbi:protein kinase domain-containing protein [Micromonospora sp. DT81.3]|uniref:protein kinase domain-containing protein n=1 Tax=Micromonospora sp. DT81.3 TaxID=3416523 RepID=UPI003CF01E7D